jgi:hypothetical protein
LQMAGISFQNHHEAGTRGRIDRLRLTVEIHRDFWD